MIRPRWRKVLQDILRNKLRTFLVVASVAVGIFAVGTIAATRTILLTNLQESYDRINPQAQNMGISPFDDELVASIARVPGVGQVEGRTGMNVKIANRAGDQKDLRLTAINDFDHQRVNKVFPQTGAWPPARKEVLLERATLKWLGLRVGDTVTLETGDHKQHQVTISGSAFDVNLPPVVFVGQGAGYITFDTREWLGGARSYTTLTFTVAEDRMSKVHIQDVADQVRARVKASGRQVFGAYFPTPGKHPADEIIAPIFLIMQVMGYLTLLLSGFLVVNTIAAVLAEHMRQIGMMKAIGATRRQLLAMYAAMVLGYGLLSLAVAVPLGMLGARGLGGFLADMLNLEIAHWPVPRNVFLLELAIALLVPLVSALGPLIQGTRVSVREAISDYGVGSPTARKSWLDRAVAGLRRLPRPLLLSLRNTIRRKGRLLRTLIVLTLGGAIFIAVFSVRASLLLTLDQTFRYWNYDVTVDFEKPQRTDVLLSEAQSVPGVTSAEFWRLSGAGLKRGEDRFSPDYNLLALPAETQLVKPTVIQGRWLMPGDENAVVLNTNLWKDEEQVQVGQEVVLRLNGKETTWLVVGIVRGDLSNKLFYVPGDYYAKLMNLQARATRIRVQGVDTSKPGEIALAKALKEHFEQQGMKVSNTSLTFEDRESATSQFNILVVFLLLMSILLAVVGGLGLAGTMSLNVLERTREIGVMRAIGAGNGALFRIVMVEGVLVGMIAWGLGALIALPMSRLLSYAVGMAFLKSPPSYVFSIPGVLLWLGVMVSIAALASWLPARRAARLSVREVLAYE